MRPVSIFFFCYSIRRNIGFYATVSKLNTAVYYRPFPVFRLKGR